MIVSRESVAECLPATVRLYHRTLTYWAADVLAGTSKGTAAGTAGPQWPQTDGHADYRDRNWHALYAGSILDD